MARASRRGTRPPTPTIPPPAVDDPAVLEPDGQDMAASVDRETSRVPLATPAPKIVTLEAVVSFNEHKVGDRWDQPFSDTVIALVDKGWVDVVGLDGFTLPTPL
jgi:hypothetical protein